MKFAGFWDGRVGICLGALLIVVGSGCATSNKAPESYSGIMGGRGIIPPAYPTAAAAKQAAENAAATTVVPGPTATTPAEPKVEDDDFDIDDGEVVAPGAVTKPEAPAPQEAKPAPAAPAEEAQPTPPAKVAPAAPVAPAPVAGEIYVVGRGDVLSRIAARHGVKVADILAVNPSITDPSKIRVGQKITLPAGVKAQSSTAAPAAVAPKSTSGTTAAAPRKGVAKKAIPADGVHTVVANDNLWNIARTYGVTTNQLRSWNNLSSDMLKVGQKLKLRGDATAAAPAKSAAPAAPAKTEAAAPAAPAENAPANVNDGPVEAKSEAAPAATDNAASKQLMPFEVGENDTLENIAAAMELTVEDILKQNPNIKGNADLKPGLILQIPMPQ